MLSLRSTNLSVLRHGELDWLTLLICAMDDEPRVIELGRVAVGAVLFEVR